MNTIDESHINREFASLDAEATLDQLIDLFKKDHDVYIFQNETYLGCVTEHDLMGYEGDETTSTISTYVNPQPVVTLETPFHEAARIILNHRTHSIGVNDKDGNFVGVISDKILIANLEGGKEMILLDHMSSNLVTISEKANISQAIDLLRANKISRIPVIDDNFDIIGLLSSHNILELFLDTSSTVQNKDQICVSDLMNTSPILANEFQTLSDAAKLMIDNNTYAIVIVRTDTKIPIGIITITDLLENQSIEPAQEGYQVKIIGDCEDDVNEYLVEETLALVSKFAYFIGGSGKVIIRSRSYPKRKFRGQILYNIRLRVIGNKGFSQTAKADSYGIEAAFQIALDHFERAIINVIDIEEDRKKTIFDSGLDDL
ncbi:MAG: CBS domain-containing protein [Candidatus Kariarchaeaceae archaeon]